MNKKPKEAGSFFFASEDALTNPDKIMVLIHGSGVVRAGQWARRLVGVAIRWGSGLGSEWVWQKDEIQLT